jgi:hypothetical protein
MAEVESMEPVLFELRALLKRSRQQEVQLLDALTRVLGLLDQAEGP